MKRVLVTGGAGFIGSNLCRRLLSDPEVSVWCYDALTYAGSIENVRDLLGPLPVWTAETRCSSPDGRFTFEQGDVRDYIQTFESFFMRCRPDTIFHLAAETHVDRSIDNPSSFLTTNVDGTAQVLQAALSYWRHDDTDKERFRLVHVSTDEVFGELGPVGTFNEHTAYAPRSPYAASKAAADHLVRAWHATYGLPTIITNCSNNYGPYQHPEKLIPTMVLNAVNGKKLPVYGSGTNIRDWLFVSDHCRALETVARNGSVGETYCVGGDQEGLQSGYYSKSERTTMQVAMEVCDQLNEYRPHCADHKRLIELVVDRPGHDARYAVDSTKIRCELGWTPQVAFEDGIRQTIEWYLTHSGWATKRAHSMERLGLGK